MKTVKALMIDPAEQIVYGVDLPVTPPKSSGTPGPQIGVEQVPGLIDCKHPNGSDLPGDKDFVFFDGNLFSSKKCHFQLGPGYRLIPGRCIIIGRDIETGDYRDVAVTGEEIARSVIWTRHAPRRTKPADTPREAIQRLVDYLYADEEEHFSECGAPPGHIVPFVSLRPGSTRLCRLPGPACQRAAFASKSTCPSLTSEQTRGAAMSRASYPHGEPGG